MCIAVLFVATACTSGDSDDSTQPADDGAETAQSVAAPAARLSPFCQAMIDLSDKLDNDSPDDVEQAIVDAYEAIAPEVPDLIRDDFDAVLAELRGEPTTVPDVDTATESTTTTSSLPDIPPVTDETGATVPVGDAFFDEGHLPGETPSERVSAYVDFECRGNQNNPGPPATQPLSAPPTSEPDE